MGRLINESFISKAGSFIGYTINGVGYIKGIYKQRTKKEAFNRKPIPAILEGFKKSLRLFP